PPRPPVAVRTRGVGAGMPGDSAAPPGVALAVAASPPPTSGASPAADSDPSARRGGGVAVASPGDGSSSPPVLGRGGGGGRPKPRWVCSIDAGVLGAALSADAASFSLAGSLEEAAGG